MTLNRILPTSEDPSNGAAAPDYHLLGGGRVGSPVARRLHATDRSVTAVDELPTATDERHR